MNAWLRFTAGLLAGCITAITTALIATLAARTLWPEYATAEPNKTYSATMLIARLAAGAVCAAGAACVTTAIARDNGKAAWWLGGLFLTASVPEHFLRIWADYPIWYHLIYLSYLVPLTGLVGWVVADQLDKTLDMSNIYTRSGRPGTTAGPSFQSPHRLCRF